MFELYRKDVTIDGVTYSLKPLNGRHLPRLFGVLKSMSKMKEGATNEDIFDALDEETIAKAHEICLETFKKSYPNEPVESLDSFVSQRLMNLLPAVIELHMNNAKP
jgi:hypothetical protein